MRVSLYAFIMFVVAFLAACSNNYKAPDDSAAETTQTDDTGTDNDTDGDSEPELTGCEDGLDNDSDGYFDQFDPDCVTGTEEVGYGSTGCNDGVDNDSDGLVDTEDSDCDIATEDEITEPAVTDCEDGIDNDGDGYTDSDDPGCEDGDGLETPFDEPAETELTDQECWDAVAFQLQDHTVNYNGCSTDLGLDYEDCFGSTDWDEVKYVDIEIVHEVNAYSSSSVVTVYHPDNGSEEGEIYLPTVTSWYGGTTAYNQEYDNGIIAVLQPDGTVVEISYYSMSAGTHRGHLLPDVDANRQDACDGVGYDTVNWIGAHGGPHITGTQAWRECEITGDCEITRGLPVEADRTHFAYGSGECSDGYTGWAASADDGASTLYTGTVEDQCSGSFLQIVPEWNDSDEDGEVDTDPSWDGSSLVNGELTYYDCSSNMSSIPGVQFCKAASQYFLFIVDDAGGEDEIQIPVGVEVQSDGSYNDLIANVITETGVDLVNARYYNNPEGDDGAYECDGDEATTEAWANDVELIMSLVSLVPPELIVLPE